MSTYPLRSLVVSTIGRRYQLDDVHATIRHLETADSSGESVIVVRDTQSPS